MELIALGGDAHQGLIRQPEGQTVARPRCKSDPLGSGRRYPMTREGEGRVSQGLLTRADEPALRWRFIA
jgi:hypothetical protein